MPLLRSRCAAVPRPSCPPSRRWLAGVLLVVVWLGAAAAAQAHGRYEDSYASRGFVFTLSAALPDPRLTPGALNPRVAPDDLRATICRRRGYTRGIRPAQAYTERLKRRQIRQYGYADHRMGDYEEDHLIPLELGGAPADPRNLWPQPHRVAGGWGSYAKDRLEDRLHALVCEGRVPLAQAQREIAADWIAAYRRYVGPQPQPQRRHEWRRHARWIH